MAYGGGEQSVFVDYSSYSMIKQNRAGVKNDVAAPVWAA
jgi:hypothetical protein